MKKRFFSIFCILLIFLIASCDLMGGSLAEYMTEYKENAFLEKYEISDSYPRDVTGTPCIEADGTITLFLRNPMKYEIGFEYVFNTASLQLLYNTQFMATDPIVYKKISDDNSIYSMTFPAAFLEAVDSGTVFNSNLSAKDISGTINAFEKETRRPFGSLELTLSANSRPMPVCNGLMQLDRDPSENDPLYILCFEIPHSARNNDLTKIQINNSTWQIEYDASGAIIPNIINITPFGGNRGKLISRQYPSDNPDNPDAGKIKTYPLEVGSNDYFEPSNPESFDTFYYITNDPQTDTETLYQITITDKAGLSTICTLSNKAEKLAQPSITIQQTPAFGPVYIADWNNTLPVTIMPARQTTTNHPVANTYIEYLVECVDGNGNSLYPDVIPEWKTLRDADTLPLPVNSKDEQYYKITARTKGSGFLASDETVSSVFKVIRSNHFFVAHENGDDDKDGTLSKPYYSFKKCMEEIVSYQSYLKEKYYFTLEDGFYIDVLEDYNVTGSNDVFTGNSSDNYHLVDSSTSFSGKLTIQGVDNDGNPLSGKSKRTVDGGQCCSFISWAGSNLTLTIRDLTLQKFSTTSSGGCISINMMQKQNSIVTIERCDITNNTTDSQGGGIWIQGGGGTNTRVTIKDCNITDNTATMGAGVHITYGGPNPSDELYVIDGNTTISNNTAEKNGGGLYICNKVEIASPNVKIIDNTSGQGGLGAGVYFGGGSLSLKGGKITENRVKGDSEIPSNLYIVSGKTLSVTGDLSGSSIGVTLADEETEAGTVFTTGFKANNPSLLPSSIFTSDKTDADNNALPVGYGSADDAAKKEAALYTPGHGTITPDMGDGVRIHLDKNAVAVNGNEANRTITISVIDIAGNRITPDSIDAHLLLAGDVVPTSASFASTSGNAYTISPSLREGAYQFYVTAVYDGKTYASTFDFTVHNGATVPLATLTAPPTSGSYSLSSKEELTKIFEWATDTNIQSNFEDVTFDISEDIDITDFGGDWHPITTFKGTINGNGHTVSIPFSSNGGLVGTNNGVIENLVIDITGVIEANTNYNFFAYTNTGIIRNCKTTGSVKVKTQYDIGSFAVINEGLIENCINEADLTYNNMSNWAGIYGAAAGIAAHNNPNGIISNCVNYGTIYAATTYYANSSTYNGRVGSIFISSKENSTIQNCYWLKNCAKYYNISKSTDINFNRIGTFGQLFNTGGNSFNVDEVAGTNTGCGYFEGTTITAGTAEECETDQTLAYGTDLLIALNAYVDAHPENNLKHWIMGADGHVTLEGLEE